MSVKNAEVTSTPAPTATPVAATKTISVAVDTPVMDRKYTVMARTSLSFRGVQRQIVYNILLASTEALTIAEITPIAEANGLKAVGGVLASVRYHLHYMVKDGHGVHCTNPTTTVERTVAVAPTPTK